jgi:hypothetical protein
VTVQKANAAHLQEILETFYIKNNELYWKIDKKNHPIKDTKAGSIDLDGYLWVRFNNKNHRIHRLMYQIYNNIEVLNQEMKIDHKDRNKLNNSKDNLQLVTCFENSHNLSKHPKNTSGYTGVHWRTSTKKWRVTMASDNRIYELGHFSDIIEAAEAYDIGCLRRDPNNHVLNFPDKKEQYLKYIAENGNAIGHDERKPGKVQSGHKYVNYMENKSGVKRWRVKIIKDGKDYQQFFPFTDEGLQSAIQWRNAKYQELFGQPFPTNIK